MRARLWLLPTAAMFLMGLVACSTGEQRAREASSLTGGGNPADGLQVIRYYGCNTCHTISGVPGARGEVGPELNGIMNRTYIAGVLPNNPTNLMRWIQHPQSIVPNTAMPEMNVSDQDSRNIAAYLYSLQ
jgi:cytochrome c